MELSYYEILSSMLRNKKKLINISILDVLMNLVGRSLDRSLNATITNSSALRYLVFDVELWRTSKDLQQYYLNQIADLIIHSDQKMENIDKLNDISIIRRFLIMMKMQIIYSECLGELAAYLKIFLKYGFSSDIMKSICSFLVYTLPKSTK